MSRLDDLKVQDKILTSIAQGYADQRFVSDEIFKDTQVERASDKFPLWDDHRFVDYGEGLKRPLRVPAKQKDWDAPTYDTYSCSRYSLGDRIEKIEIQHSMYEILNEEVEDSMFLLKVAREKARATLLSNSTNYPAGNKITPATKWDDASVNIVKEIDLIKDVVSQKLGIEANTVLMGKDVFLKLKEKSELSEKIKYTQKDLVTTDLMASLFGVEKVLVGESLFKASKTGALTRMWGNMLLVCYVNPRSGRKIPTFARGFRLKGFPEVKKWVEQADMLNFRVDLWYDDKITGPNAGYLVTNPVT